MNKLSKLTALLLAIVLALSVPLGAMAEDEVVDTWTEYMDVASEALKTKIMAYETYGEYWDMAKLIEESDFKDFFYTLPLEDQIAIAEYVNGMFWDSLVGFTNVAPLPELVATESASTFRLLARDGEDSSTTSKNIFLEKTATGPDNNGEYTITLESFVTGTVTTTTTTEIKPVDIVLVLDDSGSMAYDFASNSSSGFTYTKVDYSDLDKSKTYYVSSYYGGYTAVKWCESGTHSGWYSGTHGGNRHNQYGSNNTFNERSESKGEALINAVNNFVDSVNANKPTTGTHQMSIVKFRGNNNAYLLNDWTAVSNDTVDALKLTGNDLQFNGGTYIDDGLTMAKDQLNELTTTDRQRVVIVFTDGIPGSGSWGGSDGGEAIGVSAIGIAKSIKAMENTTVYTVAVLKGADPAEEVYSSTSDNDEKINAILHAISSNYPEATASRSGTTLNTTFGTINPKADLNGNGVIDNQTINGKKDASYYLTADSPAALNNIFQAISSSIQSGSTTSTLTETTVVKDVMSPYFELPYTLNADGTRNYDNVTVTVTTQKYTGEKVDGARQWETETLPFTPTIEKGHDTETGKDYVTVSNFDFMGNYVADVDHVDPYRSGDTTNDSVKFYGRKLIIQFKVKPTAGFLGGNDVVTNDSSSGIYKPAADSTPENPKFEIVDDFDIPDVDVDLWEIEVVGKHQHIFLSNEADVNELLQSFSLKYTKAGGTESYTVNGIRNDYATLVFTLTDTQSGNAMVYTILPGDTAGTWSYKSVTGDPITAFDVTPFLTKDAEYRISYDVIPIPKEDTSNGTGVVATSGYLYVEVHVFKPTFTFQDSVEDYLAPETADGYYSRNNYVGDNANGIYRETWSHTYYDEITVTIYVADDGTLSYRVVNADGSLNNSDDNWDMANGETINFSGYGKTDGETYNVTMTGQKPTVQFTYSPVETEWIKNNQVSAVECVKVNVTEVKLTSTNTHKKTILDNTGAVTGTTTYTTTSEYKEGSGNASVKITVNDDSGTTSTPAVTGTHITTKRIEDACSFCGTTDGKVDSTDIHSTSTLEFVVHIKNAFSELKIIKEGLSVGESAIFTVAGVVPDGTADGKEQTWTVVLTKTSADAKPSVTITGLLVNSQATVVEDGNWSWRYQETKIVTSPVTILPKTASNYPAKVTVTNNNRTDQWLSDESHVENDFSQPSTTNEGGEQQ